jgi:hypothetical protein
MIKNLLRFLPLVAALNCCHPLPAFATINSATRSVEITGASQTVFTVPYQFSEASALKVTKVLLSSGVGTVLTITVDYTVTVPSGNVLGKVTTTSPVTSLYKLRIERTTPLTQLTAFSSQGAYFPQLHEKALDKLTMALQDNPGGGGGGSGVTDGDKGDIIIGSVGTLYTIDPAVATTAGRELINDIDAAAQRTTLGLGTLATQSGTFSGTHSGTSSGTNTGDQTITLTGDTTGSGAGSFATTIANDAVTNAKSANMAVNTIKGRITSGTGDPEDLTAANVRTIITAVSGSSSAYMDGTGAFTTPPGGGGWKLPVRAATTAHIASKSGSPATIDGVSCVNGDRVLLKTQTPASENGIYVINSGGAWPRATDLDGAGEAAGALVYVQEGSTQADTAWRVTTDETITVGSTSITWVQFGAGGSVDFAAVNAALATANADIVVNSAQIDGLAYPTSPDGLNGEATNVGFVNIMAGATVKYPVKVATTANVTLSGAQTVDGVLLTVSQGQRVLVKNQTTTTENGIYQVNSGAWGLVSDYGSGFTKDHLAGFMVYVTEGSTQADTLWGVTNDGTITIGSTSLAFAQVDQKAVLAGTGLTRSTNTLSVNSSQSISTLSNLTSNGFVKTSGGTGALSIDTSNYITGNQTITLSSDVTGSGTTAITATIANDAVTNAKAANMANATIKCRTTAGTGDPEDCTATQTTALLNNVVGDSGSGGTKGLVPAPGAGDAAAGKFLKADGTWTAPAGGGGSGYLGVWHFQAESLDDADTNWPTTANAVMTDSVSTASVQARKFLGASLTGAGGKITFPHGSTSCLFEWVYQASAAPGATNNKVQWEIGTRSLGTTGSNTVFDFTVQTNANNTNMAYFSQTVSLSTLSLSADTPYQFQLLRKTASVTNNMTQDAYLSEWTVSCN